MRFYRLISMNAQCFPALFYSAMNSIPKSVVFTEHFYWPL